MPEHLRGHVFKPGQSGNPGGRPKHRVSFEASLQRYLTDRPELIEKVIGALIDQAVEGDKDTASRNGALKIIAERLDGAVMPRTAESSEGDERQPTKIVLGDDEDDDGAVEEAAADT